MILIEIYRRSLFERIVHALLRYTNTGLKISLYVQDPEIFTLLTLTILELFTRKVCIFAKK